MGKYPVTVFVRHGAAIGCWWPWIEIQDVHVSEPSMFCMEDSDTIGDALLTVTGTESKSIAKEGMSCWNVGGEKLISYKLCLKSGSYTFTAAWKGISDTREVSIG